MRALLLRLLRKTFEARLAEMLPDFRLGSESREGGRFRYVNEAIGGIFLQVTLVVDRQRDRFAVCVGWNTSVGGANGFIGSLEGDDVLLNPCEVYLDKLWRRPYRGNEFWDLNPFPSLPLDEVLAIGREVQDPKTPTSRRLELASRLSAPKVAVEELAPLIPRMVDEAMQQLRQYGIPFFERIEAAKQKGSVR